MSRSNRHLKSTPAWQEPFLQMLPKIREAAGKALRRLKTEAREEAIEEVIANAAVTYARLVERGREALAYPTVLARLGARRYFDGRKVGSVCRVNEVLSKYAQRRRGFAVERLDRRDHETGDWAEAVVEDPRCGPAETAAARIDIAAWFSRLTPRRRKIAEALAVGERTSDVARWYRVSAARIAQMRGEFWKSWRRFHGEGPAVGVA